MDREIQDAQKKLEEKRDLLKRMDQTQIGLEPDLNRICPECSTEYLANEWQIRMEKFSPKGKAMMCSACMGKQREKEEEEQKKERAEYQERMRREEAQQRLQASGLGERFIGMTWENYKPVSAHAEKVFIECKAFAENFDSKSGKNLLLIGSPGTGKNMLAAIICQELIKKAFTCSHTTAIKAVRRIKDSWRDKEEGEQEVIDSFIKPSLLVIDEVGVQFGSPTELLYLTEVINERYEKRRPTILISNLTIKQLEEIIGHRIMDRFYEDGSKFLVFNWQSYRRQT